MDINYSNDGISAQNFNLDHINKMTKKQLNPTKFFATNYLLAKRCELCMSNIQKSSIDTIICQRFYRIRLCLNKQNTF